MEKNLWSLRVKWDGPTLEIGFRSEAKTLSEVVEEPEHVLASFVVNNESENWEGFIVPPVAKNDDLVAKGFRADEVSRVAELLEQIEQEYYAPFAKISGGFATVEVLDVDDDKFDVAVEAGVHEEDGSAVETTQFEVDRKTLKKYKGFTVCQN